MQKFQWHLLVDIVLAICTVVFGACCLPSFTQQIKTPLWAIILVTVILLVTFIYLLIRNHQLHKNYICYRRVEQADPNRKTLKTDNLSQISGGELVSITYGGLVDVIAFGRIAIDPIDGYCTIKDITVLPGREEDFKKVLENDPSILKNTFVNTCILEEHFPRAIREKLKK